jgi:hypothetical protein
MGCSPHNHPANQAPIPPAPDESWHPAAWFPVPLAKSWLIPAKSCALAKESQAAVCEVVACFYSCGAAADNSPQCQPWEAEAKRFKPPVGREKLGECAWLITMVNYHACCQIVLRLSCHASQFFNGMHWDGGEFSENNRRA